MSGEQEDVWVSSSESDRPNYVCRRCGFKACASSQAFLVGSDQWAARWFAQVHVIYTARRYCRHIDLELPGGDA
jgi:hypothetical protein